jgi:hypothetical protein
MKELSELKTDLSPFKEPKKFKMNEKGEKHL